MLLCAVLLFGTFSSCTPLDPPDLKVKSEGNVRTHDQPAVSDKSEGRSDQAAGNDSSAASPDLPTGNRQTDQIKVQICSIFISCGISLPWVPSRPSHLWHP